jgi:hypothetical protein
MNKIIVLAFLALTSSVAITSSASAFAFSEEAQQKLDALKAGKGGSITSPGDAFRPQVAGPSIQDVCAETGGELKRQFNGTEFVWICIA